MSSLLHLVFLAAFVSLAAALPVDDDNLAHKNAIRTARNIPPILRNVTDLFPDGIVPGKRDASLDKRKDGTVCMSIPAPVAENYDDCNVVCTTLLQDAGHVVSLMPYYIFSETYGNCMFTAQNTNPCDPTSFKYGTLVALCQVMMTCLSEQNLQAYHVGDSIGVNFAMANPQAKIPYPQEIPCQDGPPPSN